MQHDVKRSLVTGGAGFLGSHLCERLLAQGDEVWCLDNLSSGRQANIAHLLEHPRFHWLEQDVCTPVELPVQAIYNLACPASPVHYQADPVATTRTCVMGALNMLELARRQGATILQASTSEVYGDPLQHPQQESYWGHVNPVGPRSCYDEGKRCAESLFFDYQRQYGVAIKVVRIFNTYGPRMRADDGRVVSNFIVQALRGEPLSLYGDGRQTRSFCYVDDLLEGLLRMMASPPSCCGPLNLGNPDEFSMAELAAQVIALTGSQGGVRHAPLPADDPRQRQPDISQARAWLDWQPQVRLASGLASTVAYFRKELAL